jgi:hypothetical protein
VVSTIERIAGRRQINELIRRDLVVLSFHRRPKIDLHGGGWRWGPELTLQPQELALIPFKRRMTDFLLNTELGHLPDLPYVFLGRWDLDVAKDDWFTWGGDKFVVKTIDFKTEIRVTGQVDYLGETDYA